MSREEAGDALRNAAERLTEAAALTRASSEIARTGVASQRREVWQASLSGCLAHADQALQAAENCNYRARGVHPDMAEEEGDEDTAEECAATADSRATATVDTSGRSALPP